MVWRAENLTYGVIKGHNGEVAGWHVTPQQRPLWKGPRGSWRCYTFILWNKSLLFYGELVYFHLKPSLAFYLFCPGLKYIFVCNYGGRGGLFKVESLKFPGAGGRRSTSGSINIWVRFAKFLHLITMLVFRSQRNKAGAKYLPTLNAERLKIHWYQKNDELVRTLNVFMLRKLWTTL